jgi:hypothetical protein
MILDKILGWFKSEPISKPALEIIHFQCNGCMATDWEEVWRGHVIDTKFETIYGSPSPVKFIIVEVDGKHVKCFANYCQMGSTEMQQWTRNPEESLLGKMVYLT